MRQRLAAFLLLALVASFSAACSVEEVQLADLARDAGGSEAESEDEGDAAIETGPSTGDGNVDGGDSDGTNDAALAGDGSGPDSTPAADRARLGGVDAAGSG